MIDAKLVADMITAGRAMLGLALIWLGLAQGADALPAVVMLMLLDWTGDFIDGTIAKRSRHPRRSWIGDCDVQVDAFVSIGLGIYMMSAGFVVASVGFWYAVLWVLIFMRFGLERNLLMLAQTPVYLWFIIVVLQLAPSMGNWLIVWVGVALVINWRRFSRETVPTFIRTIMAMGRGRRTQ